MNSRAFVEMLNSHRVRVEPLGFHGLISVFDDDFYGVADSELVSSEARTRIKLALLNEGWKILQEGTFGLESLTCTFSRPSERRGANPMLRVIENIGKHEFCFVTSTQALLLMIKFHKWDVVKACHLVEKQPADLEKVWHWAKEDGLHVVDRSEREQLKSAQSKGLEARKNGIQNLYPHLH